jgi:hypothetical protein
MGLHGLLHGQLYLFFFTFNVLFNDLKAIQPMFLVADWAGQAKIKVM